MQLNWVSCLFLLMILITAVAGWIKSSLRVLYFAAVKTLFGHKYMDYKTWFAKVSAEELT